MPWVGLLGDSGWGETGMKLERSVRSASWMSGGRVGGGWPGTRAVGRRGFGGSSGGFVGLRYGLYFVDGVCGSEVGDAVVGSSSMGSGRPSLPFPVDLDNRA